MKVSLVFGQLTEFNGVGTWSRVIRAELLRRGDQVTDTLVPDADLVLLPEAKVVAENEALVRELLDMRIPLVTGFHGPHYPSGLDYLELTAALCARADRVWATKRVFASPYAGVPVDVELPYLAYAGATTIPGDQRSSVILMTGRLIEAKGQVALARLAPRLRGLVVLAGDSNMNYDRHLLTHLTWGLPFKSKQAGTRLAEYPFQTHQPWQGRGVRYHGRYGDALDLFAEYRPRIHVNLTSRRFSPGHLEYTTLEALAAGIRCVVPEHAVEGLDYLLGDSLVTVPYETGTTANDDVLVAVFNELLQRPAPQDTADNLARHDPREYLQQLFDEGATVVTPLHAYGTRPGGDRMSSMDDEVDDGEDTRSRLAQARLADASRVKREMKFFEPVARGLDLADLEVFGQMQHLAGYLAETIRELRADRRAEALEAGADVDAAGVRLTNLLAQLEDEFNLGSEDD